MEKKNFKQIIFATIILIIALLLAVLVSACADNKKSQINDDTTNVPSTISENSTDTTKTDETLWNLLLVNKNNPLPEHYEFNVKQLDNGQAVDERCYDDLQKMMDDCRSAGLTPVICSSYRTFEKQQQLFDAQIEKWKSLGYSESDAVTEAGKLVAVPGTSEHQLGLALDIVDISYQLLEEEQEDTPVQKWLFQNSWKYGFILRYPKDKTAVTGISYEPWHYRYVGKAAAKEIFDLNICLEEYPEK